jgi:hypothetical protein
MPEKIEVDYHPEYQDFLRITLQWMLRRAGVLIVVLVFVLLTTTFYAIKVGRAAGLIPTFIPLALLGLLTWSVFLSARRSVKALKPGIKYTFAPEGVEVTGPEIDAKFGWSNYHSIKETKKDFVLSPTRNALIPFPKRLFRHEDEIEQFRDLVRGTMGNKAKLKK